MGIIINRGVSCDLVAIVILTRHLFLRQRACLLGNHGIVEGITIPMAIPIPIPIPKVLLTPYYASGIMHRPGLD